jgi:hypothetical protein
MKVRNEGDLDKMVLTFLADAVSHEAHKSYRNIPSLILRLGTTVT